MIDFGIRRETKNRWERRAPLAPRQVRRLIAEHGHTLLVRPSPQRVFADELYLQAGARVEDDLSSCRVILGVKEVPLSRLLADRAYLFFAHVIKGQPQNLPMLRGLLAQRCTLIDYECVVDDSGRRLIFFGRHAGYAGMIDGLWALGRRLRVNGVGNPFTPMRQARDYPGVAEAREVLRASVAPLVRDEGVPDPLHPLVVGVTGGGNVASGAQEILDSLPVEEIAPGELAAAVEGGGLPRDRIYKTVFRRADRRDFARYLPYLTLLVNGIYWQPGHPRLVTVKDLKRLWRAEESPRLAVIADLSCDLEGSIEATVRLTTPGDPVYVFDPESGETASGVRGRGPVILAVENLPSELPRDASEYFGERLAPFLPALAAADFSAPYEQLALPPPLKRAVITHQGALTPPYRYLADSLARHVA